MAEPELCRTCSRALPDDAPWGLCPACLLGQAIEGEFEEPLPTEESHSRLADRDACSTVPPGKVDDEARPANFPEFVGRYRLEREIGRGGMGQVILGVDVEIGREIALKVLIEKYRDSSKMTSRFVEEAQIGGRLVHPAIVPVYEMGTFPDGRPFFVMKLVEGRTLADLLSSRSDPTEDLPRYLSIFDQVCQAMAYAHFRRVIHRDLKSSNVMVGAFGEVQTMDWGMAKLISREGQPEVKGVTLTISDGPLVSVDGSVKGTPNYMSPEQARGEGDRLDERTDVFSLGAILCEILTGRPPYLGESSEEILAKAAQADLAEALAELSHCGADVELQTLARHCLATDQGDRPNNAGEVATEMAAYFEGVQDRLRQAELDRVEAETRAEEESKRRVLSDKLAVEAEGRVASERKRRRATLALAVSLLVLTIMGGLGANYFERQRRAKAATMARLIGEVSTLLEVARANPEDLPRWRTALVAANQAESVAADDPDALRQIAMMSGDVRDGAKAAENDGTLLEKVVDIRSRREEYPDGRVIDTAYTEAFQEAGFDFSTQPPAEIGSRLKGRPPTVTRALVAALDDWGDARRRLRNDYAGAGRLAEVSRTADPDPWRTQLRETLALRDDGRRKVALRVLAETAEFDKLDAVSFVLLGYALAREGDPLRAETVLRRAQRRHPGDVWVNYDLARVLDRLNRADDAIRFHTAARAVRPATAHELAHALAATGKTDEAIEVFQDLTRLRPKDGRHLVCLGRELQTRGRSKEAGAVFEQAVAVARESSRLRPDDAQAHDNLGRALASRGRLDEAVAEHREAIRLFPNYPEYIGNLGNALQSQGKLDEAIAVYREVIRIMPDQPGTHRNLAESYGNLATALASQGKLDEAINASKEAIRLKPDQAEAHSNLAVFLTSQGKLDEAVDSYKKAIRLRPDLAVSHFNLGNALAGQGNLPEAEAECREAIRLQPEFVEAHLNLGEILKQRGDFSGSLAMIRKVHELGIRQPSWQAPSAMWVREAERLAALAERLPALLNGKDHIKDNVERMAVARICHLTKRYVTSVRFWTQALHEDPRLGDDPQAGNRYDAACAAAMASAGRGRDEPPPEPETKVKFRRLALGWLREERDAWTTLLESGPPQARPLVVETLRHWQMDTDLADIRDPEALAMLSEAERKEWQSLWADVEALLKRAQEKSP